MMVEIKPEHQQLLERAAKSGMSADDLLDQAFEIIREQFRNDEWMVGEREAITAQVAEGFAQSERGELMDPESAMRVLRERRTRRQIA